MYRVLLFEDDVRLSSDLARDLETSFEVAIPGASQAGGFDPLHVASSIGADLVVRKPIDVDALTAALLDLLEPPADADD